MAFIRRNLSILSFLILFSCPSYAEYETLVKIEWRSSVFYVDVTIDGIEGSFMVDTGAGQTSVSKDMFDKLNANGSLTLVRTSLARAASGQIFQGNHYRVDQINIDGCVLSDVIVAHYPNFPENMLGIGTLDYLSPFVFDTAEEYMLLSNCE